MRWVAHSFSGHIVLNSHDCARLKLVAGTCVAHLAQTGGVGDTAGTHTRTHEHPEATARRFVSTRFSEQPSLFSTGWRASPRYATYPASGIMTAAPLPPRSLTCRLGCTCSLLVLLTHPAPLLWTTALVLWCIATLTVPLCSSLHRLPWWITRLTRALSQLAGLQPLSCRSRSVGGSPASARRSAGKESVL